MYYPFIVTLTIVKQFNSCYHLCHSYKQSLTSLTHYLSLSVDVIKTTTTKKPQFIMLTRSGKVQSLLS